MKCKLFFLSVFCFGTVLFSHAQDDMIYENQAWVGYITQTMVSDHFSIWNDAHFVPKSFLILRTGGTYHFDVNKKLKGTTTVGYARLWLYPGSNTAVDTRNEHRPWGQTTLSHNVNRFSFTHRLRYDARFKQRLVNGKAVDAYDFNWRFRYFFQAKYKLHETADKKSQWYAYVFNEIMYDYGSIIKNNFRRNQNRFTIGAGYKHNNLAVQAGYINMLKQSPTTDQQTMAHTAMVMVFHNFDLRKKTKPSS